MYRAHGPEAMRPVGETEFVAGMAAMSESGQYGPTRVAKGIVGFADLTLGDRVQPVLEALITAAADAFAVCVMPRRGMRARSSATAAPPPDRI
jgi:L-fuconolactonase